ncbi:MAG: hypothetical protein JXN65_05635 [Clostridia bacterium]|nr:hypothetical protein [Clostridia bacterium]
MEKKIKIFVLIFLLIGFGALSSCSFSPKNLQLTETPSETPVVTEASPATFTPSPTPTEQPTPEPSPTPRSGPLVVGIYKSGSGGRVLLTEYVSKWKRGEDIATFNTFASNEPILNYAAYRDMLVDCWFSFPDAESYKIGYCLKYTLVTGEEFSITIKKPSDITHTEYLEVYLYDSVQQYNRSAGWYTHLSDDDMDDETLLYSFKLTPGVKIKEVDTIKLMAFVYKYNDESDFDPESGEYIGTVSYAIDIIKQD